MCMFKSAMFQMIEITIKAGAQPGNQIPIQNQPQLQSIINDAAVYIKAIEAFDSDAMAFSPFTIGQPVITPADLALCAFTLSVGGVLAFNVVPLAMMNRLQISNGTTATAYQIWLLKNVYKTDWTKSYVQFSQTPAAETDFSVLLGVHYSYCADPGDSQEERRQR